MSTFQERFDADIMNEKVFSAMKEAGLDPDWTYGPEFDYWFKTLSQNEPETFQNLCTIIIEAIPYGVDKQQGP